MRLRRGSGRRMRLARIISVGYSGQRHAPPHVSLLGLLGAATTGYDPASREQVEHLAVRALDTLRPVLSGFPASVIASALLVVNAELWDKLTSHLSPHARTQLYRVGLNCLSDEAADVHKRRIALGAQDVFDDLALVIGLFTESVARSRSGCLGSKALLALTDDSLAQHILDIAAEKPLLTLSTTTLLLAKGIARTIREREPRMSKTLFSVGLRALADYIGHVSPESQTIVRSGGVVETMDCRHEDQGDNG